MSRISRCLLCEALLKDNATLQTHLTDHHQVLSVEGLYLLTHAETTPPPPEIAPATILRCPLCEALLKAHFIKTHLMEHHHVLSDQHNALSSKCYSLLMRAKPYPYILPSQKSSPLTPTTSPGLISEDVPAIEHDDTSSDPIDRQHIEQRSPGKESPAPPSGENNYNYSPEQDGQSGSQVSSPPPSGTPGPPQHPHHHPTSDQQEMPESSQQNIHQDQMSDSGRVVEDDGQRSPGEEHHQGGSAAPQGNGPEVHSPGGEDGKEHPPQMLPPPPPQDQETLPPQTLMQPPPPPIQQHIIKEEVLDDGGGSSDEGEQHHPSPMETNHDIAPPSTFKGKSWLTEPNPHPSTQGYRVVPMYRSFIYNPPPTVQTHHPAPPPPPAPRIEEQQRQQLEQQFIENTPQTGITFYEGQSFANFQQFKVLWDRYLSDTQTMVQKRSSKTGHDATYFPYKHVLYVCFYYGKASWRDMEDSKAANNRKCRFKLRLHFDTKVGRYRITKYNGSHSNHQLGKVQRQNYSSNRQSYASQQASANNIVSNPSQNVSKRGDELLKAHSILRTHPLSSLTPLQHQSLGQDILFWQSGSMRELAESNPRLLSLSTLYPVAKEDFVLHLFYAHKGEEKYLVAWTFINCAVQRSAEIALTIFARFNPITQKQAELVVMNHSIEWVASAINIFCKAIFHLSLDNVHEHLRKRLHSSCDWERVENGAEKHKLCLQLLERVVYAKNETDYAINLKELELAGPATFMEYFYNNWNNKKDFWVFYIQQRTAEALKSSHLDKQESKIENFLTINRKSLTSCISLLMLFGEAPERLNAHLSLLETSQEPLAVKQIPITLPPAQQDIKPNIVHRSPPAAYTKSTTTGEPNNFPPASPAYDPPNYPTEFFAKSVERPSPAGQHKDSNGGNENSEVKTKEEGGKERLFSGESYEEGPSTPAQEANTSNAEYSPEYGISEEKVQYGQWKNGDFSNSPNQQQDETQESEQPQDCSGSEEEASPARDFPTSRTSANYPAFNPALFPPGAVASQFLPRHTFVPPPGSFPPPYLHTSREFPPLARAMFPPATVPREIFSQPPIHSPVERESGSPFSQSQ
ncbi:hypothetical protein ACHWQZ_G010427 [Mnemiopsis leidyi]